MSALFTERYRTQSQSGTQYAQIRESEPLKHLINICIVSIWIVVVVVVVYADVGCHCHLLTQSAFCLFRSFCFWSLIFSYSNAAIVVGVTDISRRKSTCLKRKWIWVDSWNIGLFAQLNAISIKWTARRP